MTYFPRFVFPWALLLLILLPWSIYVGMKIRSLSKGRLWTATTLRCLILAALIAALAGAELVKRTDKLAVYFLLDYSDSIPRETVAAAAQSIREAAHMYMTDKDEAGVIVFGEESSIELKTGPSLDMGEILSYVGGEQTDLASAIRLAMAAFPEGYMRRIVVLSDGNETRGAAVEEAKLAAASGAAVDVIPLQIGGTSEVRLREVSVPGRVNSGEPFQTRVIVSADQDCQAVLRLYQGGGSIDNARRLLGEQQVTLQKGENSFLLPQELQSPGFYEYEAKIEPVAEQANADTILANNEAQAYTIIQGEPRVLYVDAHPNESTYLAPALRAEGVNVAQVDLGSMPQSLAQFQNYDAVVLSDVSSTDLNTGQLKALGAMVRDLGIGLVMVGGPNSFGAGGYQNTPVEEALPVSMEIKQRKNLPMGALALILHTCEIPDGNAWSRDIGIAALEVLSSRDYMGALIYGAGGEGWLFDLQPVLDKAMMRRALTNAMPGDMPDVNTTLTMAYSALRVCPASVKRVVIISDGDPAGPPRSLLNALADEKISVSTICIAPHSGSDQNMLRGIAEATGGNYYFVTDPTKLPQIFTKEAAVVKQGLLVEEPFTPQVLHDSEVLQGITTTGANGESAIPQLNGYVTTSPKETATIALVSHKADPVLAHWRYGLGKSVAFTSDVTTRWAEPWLTWPGFNRFWAQTVRWSTRDLQKSSFRVETRVKDGKGIIRIDAVDENGKFVNFLQPKGAVTGPGPDFKRQDIEILQTAPGIYEGRFPLDKRGVYMINVTYDRGDGSTGMIPAGLALGYSREYEYNTTNVGLLESVASVGGGAVRAPNDNFFAHNLPIAAAVTPVWQYLLMFAVCIFPLEIFVRRVMIDFGALFAFPKRLLAGLPLFRRWIRQPAKRRRVATGVYGGYGAPGTPTAAPGASSPAVSYTSTTADTTPAFQSSTAPDAQVPGAPTTAPPQDELTAEMFEEEAAPRRKKQAERSEYMRQLLEAKQRAVKKHSGKGTQEDQDDAKP